jgi:hypothetical protein
MRVTSVRLFFIYVSFVTAGLWFGVYLTLAFWIKLKDLIRAKDLLYLICKTSINKKGQKASYFLSLFYNDTEQIIYLDYLVYCFLTVNKVNCNPIAIQTTSLIQLSFGNEYIKAKQITIPAIGT